MVELSTPLYLFDQHELNLLLCGSSDWKSRGSGESHLIHSMYLEAEVQRTTAALEQLEAEGAGLLRS